MGEVINPLGRLNRTFVLVMIVSILFLANFFLNIRDVLFIELMFKYLPLNLLFIVFISIFIAILAFITNRKGKKVA